MGAVNQFLVLKRDNKWVVKSGDLEKLFSTQREAVDAAIRLANDSGKEGKPGVVLVQKSKSEFEKVWIRRDAGLDETPAHQASWSASFQLVKHALDEIALRDLSLPIAGAARICD